MKSRLCFILFFLIWVAFSAKAEWQRPVINYTRHAYKAGNQNWMLQQHENGWLYVANNKGLLEFDGTAWNLYSMSNAKMRAAISLRTDWVDWTILVFRTVYPMGRWLALFGTFCKIGTKSTSSPTVVCSVGRTDGWNI